MFQLYIVDSIHIEGDHLTLFLVHDDCFMAYPHNTTWGRGQSKDWSISQREILGWLSLQNEDVRRFNRVWIDNASITRKQPTIQPNPNPWNPLEPVGTLGTRWYSTAVVLAAEAAHVARTLLDLVAFDDLPMGAGLQCRP